MARSSALAVEGRGPALGQAPPSPLAALLRSKAPTIAELGDAQSALLELDDDVASHLASCFSPQTSLSRTWVHLNKARRPLRDGLALVAALARLPDAALWPLCRPDAPLSFWRGFYDMMALRFFAHSAALHRARREMKAQLSLFLRSQP